MRLTLFLLAFLSLTISYAQNEGDDKINIIEKGRWILNGNISVGFSDSDTERTLENSGLSSNRSESDTFSFDIFPQAGYAIKKNLVLGLGIGYGNLNSETTFSSLDENQDLRLFSNEFNTESFSVFPFIRLYAPIGNVFSFFFQGESSYTRGLIESRSGDGPLREDNSDTFFIGIRPGFTFFISKKFAIEANLGALGYSFGNTEFINSSDAVTNSPDETEFNSFSFSLNSADLRFGLAYYF